MNKLYDLMIEYIIILINNYYKTQNYVIFATFPQETFIRSISGKKSGHFHIRSFVLSNIKYTM